MTMFRNLKKERELIDRELDVYKKEKMNRIDESVNEYRMEKRLETDELLRKSLKQLGEYEHEFHFTKETRRVELEKLNGQIMALEAQISTKKEVLDAYKINSEANDAVAEALRAIIESKDEEIIRLVEIIDNFIENQPEQIIVNKHR